MAQRLRNERWRSVTRILRPLIVVAVISGSGAALARSEPDLLWLDEHNRPTDRAEAALAYIRNVRDEGLNPADFESRELDEQAAALDDVLAFDRRLTENMLRYLRQLHQGRVDPRTVGFDLPRPADRHDVAAILESAVAREQLDAAVVSLRPPFIQYRALRDALKTYRAADPHSRQVQQIELALERLRWLPELDGRLLVVNIPMFHLWGWDRERGDGKPEIDMAVVVGRARATKTPVFSADLIAVTFRPYWNVPASIVRNEILPALARDAGYLALHDMEIVGGSGADTRIRQRPGPTNALGLMKLEIPNKHDVYLHGTPATELFRSFFI